jgi:hypothetical protein
MSPSNYHPQNDELDTINENEEEDFGQEEDGEYISPIRDTKI